MKGPLTMPETDVNTREILIEVRIEAPVERVWKSLVHNTADWWLEDFYTDPKHVGFELQPKLGGWMLEDWGDGEGLIWGTVGGLRAPSFLQVFGDSSPQWGGPNRNILTWRLEEADNGGTVLRFEHAVFGKVSAETEASLGAGWKQLFGEGLKPYAETSA